MYSGYAFQNDSDRSATLENLTPVVDPIASTNSTQLKLSSFPNPHIAWIYYKVDALTHFILETKLTSPTISGQPITTNNGDVTSSATHPNWNHEPTVDMRNAPNSFGISCQNRTNTTHFTSKSAGTILPVILKNHETSPLDDPQMTPK